MKPIDLHPEDLLHRYDDEPLAEREKELVEEHLESCSVCALERSMRKDFADELLPAPEDDQVVAAVLDRVLPSTARPARRRAARGPWIAAAVAVILFGAGAGAAIWTAVSTWSHEEPPTEEGVGSEPQVNSKAHAQPRSQQPNEELLPEPVEETSDESDAEPTPSVGGDSASRAIPTAGELFVQANRARRARQHAKALGLYRELRRRYPGSREEVASRVSHGRLMLDHLRNPRGALGLFEGYLATSPRGNLAQEARLGKALSLGRLGRSSAEARAWRYLLQQHPGSIHADRARDRLRELGDEEP